MLLHTIKKYKESERKYVPWVQPNRTNRTQIRNQAAYDEWLKLQHPLHSFVRFGVHSSGNVSNLWMVNYVIHIEPDFDKLIFSSSGQIESHMLMQLGQLDETPWIRWGCPADYTVLDDALTSKFVDDNVLNYVKNFPLEQAKQRVRVL